MVEFFAVVSYLHLLNSSREIEPSHYGNRRLICSWTCFKVFSWAVIFSDRPVACFKKRP